MMSDLVTIDIKLPDFIKGDDIIVNTADADIVANDVVKDKIAYGANGKVVGTFEGVDTSDADATADDIVKDKTAYVGGEKVVGTHECSGGTPTDGYVPKILSTELIGWDVYANNVHTICLPNIERENVFTIDFHEAYDGAITAYGDDAFSYTNISSFTIPNTINSIGMRAFAYCDSLTSINIPSSVTQLGNSAFNHCDNLTNVIWEQSGADCISDSMFSGCSALESFNIPDSITCIGYHAFADTSLNSIIIPSNVTDMGSGVFNDCRLLESFTWRPNEPARFSDSMLSGCESLTSVIYNDNIIGIESEAFANTGLTSFTISASIEELGESIFSGCENLEEIHFASSIPPSCEITGDYGDWLGNVWSDVTIYVPTGSLDAYESAENYPQSGVVYYGEE